MLTIRNLSHDPFYNQAFEEYIYQTFPPNLAFATQLVPLRQISEAGKTMDEMK